MARIYQTGFELPGTPPNSLTTGGLSGRPGYISTNLLTAGIPGIKPSGTPATAPGYSNIGSTQIAAVKIDSNAHKSVAGLGGSLYLRLNGSLDPMYFVSFNLPYAVYDGYISFAVKGPTTASSFRFLPYDSSNAYLAGGFIHSSSTVSVLSSAGANLASPSPVAITLDNTVWHWITIEFKYGTGTKLYINTVGSTQVIEYGTLSSAIAGFTFTTNTGEYFVDDIVVHTPSVSFINCSSIASEPTGVITGGTSGATATISRVEFSDSTYGVANAGRLIVYGVSGQFVNGEEISSTNGWTATVNLSGGGESGLDFNSGKPGQTYMLGLALNGDRSGSIEMTGSDGNQIDNYLLVNKAVSASDTTYVQALGVSTAMDLYDLENISQCITGITGISYTTRVKKAGDINTVIPAIKIGDTVQYSPSTIDITGTLSYAQKYRVIDVNSATNEAFTKSQIDGAAVGLRFK